MLIHVYRYGLRKESCGIREEIGKHLRLELRGSFELAVELRRPALAHVAPEDLHEVVLLLREVEVARKEAAGEAEEELLRLLFH